MRTTFDNVSITIEAPTPKEAYTLLCNTLGAVEGMDWVTDTYDTHGADGNDDTYRDTSVLFPDGDGVTLDEEVKTMSMTEKESWLVEHDYAISSRDPKRNVLFRGVWMVHDPMNETGYCIVGDNREELINDAYDHLINA